MRDSTAGSDFRMSGSELVWVVDVPMGRGVRARSSQLALGALCFSPVCLDGRGSGSNAAQVGAAL